MSWDQEVVRVLRHVPQKRLVLLTRRGEELVTTRFLLPPVKLAFDGLVSQVAMTGEGSLGGLPEALTLALEGYRVRASLGEVAGLPSVIAAGVTDLAVGAGLPSPPPRCGYAYVSTHFIAGKPLAATRDTLSSAEKLAILRRLLRLLARLHDRLVVHGDLKPDNVVAVGDEPWLIDLDTVRFVPRADLPIPTRDLTPAYAAPEQAEEQLTFLASDVFAFGRLGQWMMEAELSSSAPGPAVETWRRLLERAIAPAPADRPAAEALLEGAGLPKRKTAEAVAATYPVLDTADPAATVQAWPGVFGAGPRRPGAAAASGRDPSHAEILPVVPRDRGGGQSAAPGAAEGTLPVSEEPELEPAPLAPEPAGSSRRRLRRRLWLGAAGAAALAVAVTAVYLGRDRRPGPSAARDASPLVGDPAGPRRYDLCQDAPSRVAVTYLFPGQPAPSPSEILSWFPDLPPEDVEIYRFTHADDGRRFVSFELSRERWSDWDRVAGDATGAALCRRIGTWLAERGIGRPDARRPDGTYDVDILAARSREVVELLRLGDLRGVANGDTYAEILDWMEPLEVAEPRCEATGGWRTFDSYLEVDCEVKNTRQRDTPVRVTATMSRLEAETIEKHSQVVLEPGESAARRFLFREYTDGDEAICECAASTLP